MHNQHPSRARNQGRFKPNYSHARGRRASQAAAHDEDGKFTGRFDDDRREYFEDERRDYGGAQYKDPNYARYMNRGEGRYGDSFEDDGSGSFGPEPIPGGRTARQHPDGQFDDDYYHWRNEQIGKFDADYEAWQSERRKKFSDEFGKWRNDRAAKSATDNRK